MTKRFTRLATVAGAIVAGALLFTGSAQAHPGVDELVDDLRSTSIDDVSADHADVLTGSETLDTDELAPGLLTSLPGAIDASSPESDQPTEQLGGLGGLGGSAGGLTGGMSGDQLGQLLGMTGMPLMFTEQIPVSALGGTLPAGIG